MAAPGKVVPHLAVVVVRVLAQILSLRTARSGDAGGWRIETMRRRRLSGRSVDLELNGRGRGIA
jgi:hypothetical protein